jgi:hypothetical protein
VTSGDVKGTAEWTYLEEKEEGIKRLFFLCEFFPVPKYWNHLSEGQNGQII